MKSYFLFVALLAGSTGLNWTDILGGQTGGKWKATKTKITAARMAFLGESELSRVVVWRASFALYGCPNTYLHICWG